MRSILELRSRRQAIDLDDAGIAHVVLHAERVAHRTGNDLQLLLVLVGEGDQHDEEAHEQAHEIGEGDEPAVAATVCFLTPRHDLTSLRRSVTLEPAPLPARPRADASPADRPAASREPTWDFLESRIINMPSMMRVRLISSSTSLRCSLSAIGRHTIFATTAPYSVASRAVAMNGPSLDGSVMLANICTIPTKVPIMPKAGAQSPIAR